MCGAVSGVAERVSSGVTLRRREQQVVQQPQRRRTGCSWCALGLRRDHPPTCHAPLPPGKSAPRQMVTWQCEQLHAHSYDLIRDAHQVVGEKQQSAPSGTRCRPDITVLNAEGKPVASIELVRTHLSKRAVAGREGARHLTIRDSGSGRERHPSPTVSLGSVRISDNQRSAVGVLISAGWLGVAPT